MLAHFEATILTTYFDVAGIPTVCTGHVVRPEDRAWMADGVTADECRTVLARDVGRFERGVDRSVRARTTQPMIDALCSLAFNIGEAAIGASSVVRLLNWGDYAGAADAFLLWRFAKVRQKDGSYEKRAVLLGRRQSEAALFRSGIAELALPPPDERTIAEIVAATQFSLFELVPTSSPIESEPHDGDELEAGRIACLPPDREEPSVRGPSPLA